MLLWAPVYLFISYCTCCCPRLSFLPSILPPSFQAVTYHKAFEISLKDEPKQGLEGIVVLAKHQETGSAVALKFHRHRETRDSTLSESAC